MRLSKQFVEIQRWILFFGTKFVDISLLHGARCKTTPLSCQIHQRHWEGGVRHSFCSIEGLVQKFSSFQITYLIGTRPVTRAIGATATLPLPSDEFQIKTHCASPAVKE